MRFSISGEPETRRDFIERRIREGGTVETTSAGKRRRLFDAKRECFHEERAVTKIGMDYAEFLITKGIKP